jgi:hypothetical protein
LLHRERRRKAIEWGKRSLRRRSYRLGKSFIRRSGRGPT